MAGRLIVCPTPIGNMEDVTLRTLTTLREADLIACEDTRRTGKLLERYGVQGKMVSYNEQNERQRTGELVRKMADGMKVALVSDAGMPLVSDPGYVLVQGCIAAGLPVEVLPGPSAALAALVASGLPSDRWSFTGFLPRKASELDELFASLDETLVAFESPKRVAASLARLAAIDPVRPVAVCRELTKLHEEVARGEAGELAERYAANEPKGEIVLVIGAAQASARAGRREAQATAAVERLVAAGAKPREAAKTVAELTGLRANDLYSTG
ncbi:MAG: 16S rRNA (cytidine(1402)-2'-O)-methyltransferase [Actinobacteria bacterium]|nr:16S rRNA (cytidine(1402)-2'-O)-methyltransferase [Actinomycetota bacterium]